MEENYQWNRRANYFYADDIRLAEKAYLTTIYIGTAENYILTESGTVFRKMYTNLIAPAPDAKMKLIPSISVKKRPMIWQL